MGIGRMIELAGEAAGLAFPVHVDMLRHSTGYALAAKGMDTRRLQHFLGHASIKNTVRYTAICRSPSRTSGDSSQPALQAISSTGGTMSAPSAERPPSARGS